MSMFSSAKLFRSFCKTLKYDYSNAYNAPSTQHLRFAHQPVAAATAGHWSARGYSTTPSAPAQDTNTRSVDSETSAEEESPSEILFEALHSEEKINARRFLKKAFKPKPSTSKDTTAYYKKATTPPEPWRDHKAALSRKFGSEGWNPRKKLSPDAMEGIRALNAQYPDQFTTPVLAKKFEVSPEAIRRILKSKWRPTEQEAEARESRWEKRAETIWSAQAELGIKPLRGAMARESRMRRDESGRGDRGRGRTPVKKERWRKTKVDAFGEEVGAGRDYFSELKPQGDEDVPFVYDTKRR